MKFSLFLGRTTHCQGLPPHRRLKVLSLIPLAISLLGGLPASGATITWNGSGPDNNWSSSGNWGGSVPTNGDALVFGGASRLTNVNDFLTAIGAVTFSSGGFNLSGNALTLNGDFINAGNNTWGINSTLGGARVLTSNSGTLTFSGSITNGNNLLTVAGAGDTLISGAVGGGSGGITKTGAGVLTLSGTNTYTGATRISGGTISITSDANLGAVPATATPSSIVIDGGILSTNGTFTLSANRGIAIGPSSGQGDGTINVVSGELSYGGIITSNTTSGTGNLVKTGNGTLTLSGVNTYSGNTVVSAGTLKLGSGAAIPSGVSKGDVTVNGTLDLNGNSTTVNGLFGSGTITSSQAGSMVLTAGANNRNGTFNGVIQNGSGTVGLTKTGTGTLTLGGGNTFTGGVTINGGALQLANAGALNSSSPNSVTFGANAAVGTKLQLNGNSVTISGLATNAAPGTVVLENANAAASTLTINQASNTTFAGTIQNGTGGGALSLVKTGAGILTLSGTNTYTGNTTISGGTLQAGSALATPSGAGTGNFILDGNASAANVGILDLNGFDISINGLSGTTGANLGRVVNNRVGTTRTLTVGSGDASTTFAGLIANNTGTGGTLNLSKTGTGTLTLTNANTYGGTTGIRNGTIISGVLNALPASTVLTLGDGTTNTSGTLRLNGFGQTLAGLTNIGTGNSNRIVNGNATAVTLTLNTGSNSSFGGILGGAGTNENNFSLVKTGTGTMTLSGTNTYTGTTTISQGTLSAGNLSTNLGGASSAVVLGDATNTGTLSYTGNSASFTRGFTVNAGGGQIDVTTSGQTLTLGTGAIATSGAFTVGGTGNVSITSNVTGTGSLNKTGSGNLTVSGVNTYSGSTNIRNGTITLGVSDTGLRSTSTLTLGDATANTNGVLKLDGFNQTLAGLLKVGNGTGNRVIGGNATLSTLTLNNSGSITFGGILGGTTISENNLALVKTNAGVLTLSGANTYTGGTTISAGTIAISANNNLGANSSALNLGAGTLQITSSLSSSRTINLTDANSTISVGSGITYTHSGTVAGTGSINLSGGGNLVLSSGSNTFSGTTRIQNGTITLGASNALPSGNAVVLGSGTGSGRLALNGNNQTLSSLTTSGTGNGNAVVNGRVTSSTLTIDSTFNFTFGGTLGGAGANENAFALTKNGTGILTLSGTNTYAGDTTVNGGTLQLGGNAAVPSGAGKGNVVVNASGIFDLNGRSATINGISGTGIITNNNAAGITLTAGANDQSTTFAGTIQNGTGAIGLAKTGTGTLTLTGTNTYSGTTTISQGVLKVGSLGAIPSGVGKGNVSLTGSLDLAGFGITVNGLSGSGGISSSVTGSTAISVGANDQTSSYGGVIANGVAGSTVGLTKVGSGTLTLTGASTYSGATLIKNGTLALGTNNDRLPTGTVVTLGDGSTNDSGVFSLSGRNQTIAGLLTAGSGTGNRVVGGSTTLSTLTVTNTDVYDFNGFLGGSGANENNLALVKGSGTLTLSGNNTFTGGVTINGGGIIRIGHSGALNSTTPNALTLAGTGRLQLNGYAITIGNLTSASSTAVIENANATPAALTVNQTGTTTYAGTLIDGTGGGALSLVKTGAGTLTLSGTNTFTGGTTIREGVVNISLDTQIGGVPGAATAGNIVLNGGTLGATASFTLNQNRGIALGPTSGSGTGTISPASGMTLTYNGILANNGGGTGGLVKTGAGILSIGGTANSYSGGTSITGGLLNITSTTGTPLGADVTGNNIDVAPGGNLSISSTSNKGGNQIITVNSNGSGKGGIGISNLGVSQSNLAGMFVDNTGSEGGVLSLNVANYNTAINLATFGNGTWFLGSGGSGSYSPTTLTPGTGNLYRLGGGGGTLTLNGTNVLTGTNGVQIGFGGLNGGGQVTVSQSQNYSGTTSILGGTLAVSADNRLGNVIPGSSGNIIINGGTLSATVGFSMDSRRGIALGPTSGSGTGTINVASGTHTFGGIISNNGSGTGGLTKTGTGTLVLSSGANTYTGATNLNGGVTSFTALNDLGQGTAIGFNGGTLLWAAGNTADITARAVTTTSTSGAVFDTGANNVSFATSAITGTGSITKQGSGTLSLDTANSYTGATTITAGTIKIGATGAIPAASALAINGGASAGGTLDLNGFDLTVGNLTGSTGTVLGRIINSTVGTNETLTTNVTANSSYSGLILDNAGVGGTVSLVKTGSSTLTLNGANTYSGGTTISAGSISISSDGNLGKAPTTPSAANIILSGGATLTASTTMTLNENRGIGIGPSGSGAATLSSSSGILTYNGIIANTGSATGGLTKAGAGIVALGGVNTYVGDTTVSAGTLRVANVAAIPSGAGKGNVSVASGSALDLNGNVITVNGLSGAGSVTSSVAGNAGIIVGDNNQTSTFSGVISNGSGVVSLGKIGTGTLTLSGTNSYTGGTTISGGTLSVASDANLGTVPGVATAGNIVINGGTLSTSASITLDSRRGIAVGPVTGSGSGTISPATGTTLTYGGIIADNGSGTGGLTKANTTGTLVLSGANTYSGDTSVLGGTLRLGNVAAIPSGTGKGNLSLASGSTLELNNLSPTVNGLSGTGTVTNNLTGPVTFTAGGNDAGGTFGGVMQDGNGTLSFTKTGSGTLVLSGVNTYSGNTTVNGGTLQLGVASALPSGLGKGNVALNGTLDLAGFSTSVNGLSGSGTVTNSSTTAATLTAGASDQTSTFSGNIQNGAGAVGLTKTGTGTLTLSGNNTFSGATNISAGTLAIGSTTGLSGNSTLTIAAAGTLDVNGFNVTMDGLLGTGTITNNGGSGATLTAGAGGTSSQFDGVITDGSPSSTISLNKSGSGTLTLTGVNTYSGSTTISNGTVSVANPGAGGNLGTATSAITLGDATNKGTLSYTGSTDLTYTRGFEVNEGGGQMNITTAGRTLTLQGGGINTVGTFTVGGAGNAVLNSVISGTGGFTKANTGTLVMNSINTYSGDTTISSGTLQLTNAAAIPSGTGKGNVIVNGTLDVSNLNLALNGLSGSGVVTNTLGSPTSLSLGSNNASGNFSGVIQDGNGTMSLVKTGSGVLQLGGANTYSGDTAINNGTLRIGNSSAIASGANKGNVSLAGSGTLDLNDYDLTVNGLSGSGLVTNSVGSAILTVGANDQTSAFSGNIQDGGGTVGLTKTGAGTLVLSGNNTFTGATSINAGVVSLGSNTALSAGSSLNIGNAGTLDLNGRVIAIDGLAGTGSLTNNGGVDVMLTTGASGGSGTFGGTINDGTAKIALTKMGLGTVTLTNANSYSGGTTVSGGTLAITADNVLGALPETIAAANIVLNGGTLSANNTFQLSSNRGIVVGDSGSTGFGGIGVATNQTLTYGGVIANNGSGTGGLNKTGAGTLNLSNANTYSGNTVVSAGTIQISNTAAIPSGFGKGNVAVDGAIDLNNHSIVVNGLSGSGTVTNTKTGLHSITIGAADQSSSFAGVIENGNGTVGMVKTGSGTLSLSGSNTFTGGTSNNSGVLAVNSFGALGDSGSISMNGGTLRFSASNTRDYSSRIRMEDGKAARFDTNGQHVTFSTPLQTGVGGSGSLVKLGSGTLTMTGANTYSGGTQVTGGVLELGNGITNGSVAGNISNAGNVTFNNGSAQTYAGAISGTGSMTKTGNGVLNMSQTSSYTGATLVTAGTLLVNGILGETDTFVADGSTLGGNGYIGGGVVSNGTVAPGDLNSIGSLGMNSLDLADTMLVQWNGNNDTIDHLGVNTLLQIRNTSQIMFSSLGGTLTKDAYVFATYGTLDSVFKSFNTVTNLPVGYFIDYHYGQDQNQIALVAIPEPGSAVLAVAGAALLLRRRRNKAGETAAN